VNERQFVAHRRLELERAAKQDDLPSHGHCESSGGLWSERRKKCDAKRKY
jgi:hypothetical protein